jgi:hypothetical protein
MTALDAGTVPLAVRVRNTRYDGLVTGYLHGGVKFTKTDPGGFRAASFTVDQRLGFRSDMIQPYSRVYVYNKRNGDCVFEGDVSHPGRSMNADGSLLDVQVEGGVERLNDWSGQRIFIDRDMQGWNISNTSTNGTSVVTGESRGGSGDNALTLAFPNSFHVETNYRAEAGYFRIRESGQELGWLNYAWDCGLIGWTVRSIVTPPSTVARSQPSSTSGSGGSGAVVGGAIPTGANVAYLQFIWFGGSSSTGTADTVWTSFLRTIVTARLRNKDGSFLAGGSYDDYVTAPKVWGDMLGTILASTFDGSAAQIDTGDGVNIAHLAYPDGVTPMQVADDLMKFEPSCTYIVGPSTPGIDKYSITWMSRTNTVRYEFMTWADEYSAGAQPVDQYNEAVTRWKSPTGLAKSTVTTQSIPEMTAMGRTRRFFQNLDDAIADDVNATNSNSAVLNDHRFPQNGGQIKIARPVVDLFTGRRVQPFEIQPGYLCRIVGINPSRDALNNNPRNGSTLCRIVNTDYDSETHSASIDLDSEPWSMFRAIAKAKKTVATPQRRG